VLEHNDVNFVVLTAGGMTKYLAGTDPLMVETAIGNPLLFDPMGNRLTALVPGTLETNYTVLVFNNSKYPVTYTLRVQGGVLVDNAGQTFSAVTVGSPLAENAIDAAAQEAKSELKIANEVKNDIQAHATLVAYEGVVKRFGLAKPAQVLSALQQLLPEAVRARQVSGELANWQDRHYLNLASDTGGGEITLTLRYPVQSGAPTHLNFWVMTQDGVRHLVQGGLAQELNLAVGLPVAGEPGVYQAHLRMAKSALYTVVVFSEGMTAADYTLSVLGGILVDRYGQTREARAAQMEVAALTSK
jgi:hypothetical protein